MAVAAEAPHPVAAVARHPPDAVAAVAAEALPVAMVEVMAVKVAMPLMATLAMPAVAVKPSRAATCQPLNKPCVARVSVRHVVMGVATAAATVARSIRVQAHHAPARVVNLTRCAPVWT